MDAPLDAPRPAAQPPIIRKPAKKPIERARAVAPAHDAFRRALLEQMADAARAVEPVST